MIVYACSEDAGTGDFKRVLRLPCCVFLDFLAFLYLLVLCFLYYWCSTVWLWHSVHAVRVCSRCVCCVWCVWAKHWNDLINDEGHPRVSPCTMMSFYLEVLPFHILQPAHKMVAPTQVLCAEYRILALSFTIFTLHSIQIYCGMLSFMKPYISLYIIVNHKSPLTALETHFPFFAACSVVSPPLASPLRGLLVWPQTDVWPVFWVSTRIEASLHSPCFGSV
jgi:hypothetical protein